MKGKMDWELVLKLTGHSPGFYITYKCPSEHLNEQGNEVLLVKNINSGWK